MLVSARGQGRSAADIPAANALQGSFAAARMAFDDNELCRD